MPNPTDIPSNLSGFDKLIQAVNERFRSVLQLLQDEYQHNPALAPLNMQTERIVNVGDPRNDFDAVNLRTLKRIAPPPLPPVIPTIPAAVLQQFLFKWFMIDESYSTGTGLWSNPPNINDRYEVCTFTGKLCQIWFSCRINPTIITPLIKFEYSDDYGLNWYQLASTLKGIEPTDFNHASTYFDSFDYQGNLEPGWLVRIVGTDNILSGMQDALIILVFRGTPSCDGNPANLDS